MSIQLHLTTTYDYVYAIVERFFNVARTPRVERNKHISLFVSFCVYILLSTKLLVLSAKYSNEYISRKRGYASDLITRKKKKKTFAKLHFKRSFITAFYRAAKRHRLSPNHALSPPDVLGRLSTNVNTRSTVRASGAVAPYARRRSHARNRRSTPRSSREGSIHSANAIDIEKDHAHHARRRPARRLAMSTWGRAR